MKNTSETTKRLNLKLNFILCLMSQIVKHELFDHLRYPMTMSLIFLTHLDHLTPYQTTFNFPQVNLSHYGLTCARIGLYLG